MHGEKVAKQTDIVRTSSAFRPTNGALAHASCHMVP